MDKIKKIYTLKTGITTEMALLVVGMVDKGNTKAGEPYVSVELFDGIKKINVNFFRETVDTLRAKGVMENTVLIISLTLGTNGFYNQNDWHINTDSSVTEKDFIHAAPIDTEKSFKWLLEEVSAVNTNPDGIGPYKSISHLTLKLLRNNENEFKRSSAAVSMHHNFLSGLLYHTIRMVCMAKKACDVYKDLDRELLVCAVALHDIGKISCYETLDVGEANMTVEGRLLDHSLTGIMMIHDASREDIYNPEKILMLEHMLASHHGKKKWDAITTPAFPEAEMLHLIDMIDSRMNMFEEAYKGQQAGTISEGKVYGLENSYIYKAMYQDEL